MAFGLLFAALALAREPLLIRTSTTDITPPEPLPLGGYTERHGKTMLLGGDPLYARTLILQTGEQRIALVSLEMLTVPMSLYREVEKKLPPDVHLFLAAVHTHCAPDSQMLNDRMTFGIPGITKFSQRWLDWYASKISSGINQALTSDPVSANDLVLREGHVPLNRPRRKDGTPDPTSNELDAGRQKLFTEYAAHATIYGSEENRTRGDWPGAVAALTGAPVFVGAIGDVSPAVDGPDPAVRVTEFRDRLEKSLSVRPTRVWREGDPIRFLQQPIQMDSPTPHPTFATVYKAPQSIAEILVKGFSEPSASVTAVRLGNLALIGIPGEPTGALGLRIVAAGHKLGFKHVIVCSHVDGWIGYILAPEDYDRGGYEATLAFNGRLEGEHVVDASIDALKSLAETSK